MEVARVIKKNLFLFTGTITVRKNEDLASCKANQEILRLKSEI